MSDFLEKMGTDAAQWAEAFCRLQHDRTVKGDAPDTDEQNTNVGVMIGWFANAIMAGYDRGYNRGVMESLCGLDRKVAESSKPQSESRP